MTNQLAEVYYTYIYQDPRRNHEPFYVGKGTGDQVWRKKNQKVQNRIAQITPSISIYSGLDEELALFLEEELIAKFGRRDLGTGSLWNFTNGGEGHSNYGTPRQRRDKAIKANASRTLEQKQNNSRLMNLAYTSEHRSKVCTARDSKLSKEELSKRARHASNLKTKEQRSIEAKLAHNRRSLEQKAELAKHRNSFRTFESRSAASKKAWEKRRGATL